MFGWGNLWGDRNWEEIEVVSPKCKHYDVWSSRLKNMFSKMIKHDFDVTIVMTTIMISCGNGSYVSFFCVFDREWVILVGVAEPKFFFFFFSLCLSFRVILESFWIWGKFWRQRDSNENLPICPSPPYKALVLFFLSFFLIKFFFLLTNLLFIYVIRAWE